MHPRPGCSGGSVRLEESGRNATFAPSPGATRGRDETAMASSPNPARLVVMTPETSALAVDDVPPADLAEAGSYATGDDAFAHSLVVLAMGRDCWLLASPSGHRLLVEPDAADRAREHLARYDRESLGWPPPPIAIPATHSTDLITPVLWAFVVLVVFNLQG